MSRIELASDQLTVQDIYGIAGWLESRYPDVPDFLGGVFPVKIAFGGYFQENPRTGLMEGELVNLHGKSQIRGRLRIDSLTFTQTYHEGVSKGDMAEFHYKKEKDGSWSGNYHLRSKWGEIRRGLSNCALTFVCELPVESIHQVP